MQNSTAICGAVLFYDLKIRSCVSRLKSKTVIAELDSAIHWQGKSKFNYFFKINDIAAVSVLLLCRFIFTMDCRIKFGNDGLDGFRQVPGSKHHFDFTKSDCFLKPADN